MPIRIEECHRVTEKQAALFQRVHGSFEQHRRSQRGCRHSRFPFYNLLSNNGASRILLRSPAICCSIHSRPSHYLVGVPTRPIASRSIFPIGVIATRRATPAFTTPSVSLSSPIWINSPS